MSHPLEDLAGPLAWQFAVLMFICLAVVGWGIYRQIREEDVEGWQVNWEPVLVALLEVTIVIVILWKVDHWVSLLIRTEGAR